MIKSQLLVQQRYLPSLISNVSNNKNELKKTVRLAVFQKLTILLGVNLLQVCPNLAYPFLCFVVHVTLFS